MTSINIASPLALGIDFGGTKIEANVLDRLGEVRWRKRVPNPGDYGSAIDTIVELVEEAEAAVGSACTVGIGAPGSPSPKTGIMRNSNSIYLNGRRFGEDLEAVLKRPVGLANDGNCLALSEAVDGAAAGAGSVFAVVLGTGVGGGLVIRGKAVDGGNGIAGEIGHNPLPWPSASEINDAPLCWCGLSGCAEGWVSGTGFARAFAHSHGRKIAAPDIIAASRSGDTDAIEALNSYINRLGRVLATIINVLDPEVIVLGGGMSNVEEIYPALPDIIRKYTFSDHWDARIVPAKWGDASGVRGAARLGTQRASERVIEKLDA